MKPIWIVDDDQSIRFVLEKALLREDLPTRSFTNTREVLSIFARHPQYRIIDAAQPMEAVARSIRSCVNALEAK